MPQSPVPVFETADEISTEASVVVILQAARAGFGPRAAALDTDMNGILSRACSDRAALAECGTCIDVIAPTRRVVVLALGEADAVTTLSLARAGGLLAAHLEGKGECAATLVLDPIAGVDLPAAEILSRVALGMRLWRYRFDMRNQRRGAGSDRTLRVQLVGASGADLAPALARINAIADGVEYARTLVNLPPNHLHPDSFHEHLEPLREAGIDVEILDPARLKELGMNAILAVGSGSVRPPRVAVLRYRGKGAPAQPMAFVGKGVCFDSGGLCIKRGEQMFDMKADMGGAAAVVGLLIALARQGSPVHAVG
ncbi:MAG: peptidase M17, partial [Mesorhizobium sp.]|nr:peptidase M17 [Mesorhizobium sp.]